jgi:ribonuclease HII
MESVVLIAGVDEVGRGALAGPVYAAAVILNPNMPIKGLADSKKLTALRREKLAVLIREQALCWAVASASVEEVDAINILQASLLAMQRAVMQLNPAPSRVLVDGRDAPAVEYPVQTIIGGDASEPAISAASILAKVARDQLMCELDAHYPGYGFASHKGYGTQQHLKALDTQGICLIHRRSYAPVASRV